MCYHDSKIRKRREDGGIKKLVWQRGFWGFGVSHSVVDNVYRFISDQKQHHQKQTFEWNTLNSSNYIGLMM
jgi:hypothetical protein